MKNYATKKPLRAHPSPCSIFPVRAQPFLELFVPPRDETIDPMQRVLFPGVLSNWFNSMLLRSIGCPYPSRDPSVLSQSALFSLCFFLSQALFAPQKPGLERGTAGKHT